MTTINVSLLTVEPVVTTNMVTAFGNLQEGMAAIGAPFNYANVWSPALDPTKPGTTFMGADGGNRDMWIEWNISAGGGSNGWPAQIGLMNFRMQHWGNIGAWQLQGSQGGTDWRDIGEVFSFDGWPEQDGNGIKQIPAPYNPTPARGYGWQEYTGFGGLKYVDTFYFHRFRIIGVSDDIPAFPWDAVGGPVFTLGKPMSFLPPPSDSYPSMKPLPSFYDQFNFIISVDDPVDPFTYDFFVQPDGNTDDPGDGTPSPPDVESPEVTALKTNPGNQYGGIWGWGDRTGPTGRASVVLTYHGADTISNEGMDHDNNYGFAGGNGITMGSGLSGPGDYFEWQLSEPQQVFTIRFLAGASGGPFGTWQLCSVADNGDNVPLGAPQPWTYVSVAGVWQYEFVVKYAAPIKDKIRLVRTDGPSFIANRWWSESQFRIVNSSGVFKGDRTTAGAGLSKRVIVSASFPPTDRSGMTGTRTDAEIWDFLVDGDINGNNGGIFSNPPNVSFGRAGVFPAFGSTLNFTFPRGVVMRKISFVMPVDYVETSASIPNKWGKWQFQRSFNNVAWEDIGAPQTFAVGKSSPVFVIDEAAQGGTPASFWRMKLVEGLTTSTYQISEVEFDLLDIGEPTPQTFGINFTDQDGLSVEITTTEASVTDPGHMTGRFKDDVGFDAHITLQPRVRLVINFADDAGFSFYSDALTIKNIVQLVMYQTGRRIP